MEGDGEGMMAIVQGLDSAGVTLTVMNRSRQNTDRRRSPRPRIQFDDMNSNYPRSSVETSTDSTRKFDTGVQICDGRYASSYKMSHCMMSPTSPPEGVSEFPPQRKEPCRNQGNFEIGGHGSGYARTNSRFRLHTGCQVRADRSNGGLLHRSKSSRYTEAFVHSLRKYPSVAGRTVSTDLIERLLKYSQSKNSSRDRSSRSMRSLHEDGSSDLHDSYRVSKHQQTYTRRPKDTPTGPIGYKGRARNFRLYSPVSESRHLRESLYRDPKFSSSYDYLRAGSTRNRSEGSPSPSGTRSPTQPNRPIRYERPAHSVRDMSLSDVSKYIRSTIRQIYRERPFVYQMCPKLLNRYYQHKKVCPVQNDGAVEPTINDRESPGSRSVSSRFLPTKSSCSEPKIGQSVGFQCNGTCCSCSKSIQCSCYPDAATNTSLTNLPSKKPKHFCCSKIAAKTSSAKCVCPEEIYKTPITCACANDDEIYYIHRIDEEISDWLKHVPVQSIEGADIKRKRDSMVRQIRKTLKQLQDDENYDDNVAKEVKSFMEDFPVWNPGKDKKDEMEFKDKLADNFIGRILGVPRKPDRFKDIVRKWAKDVDFEDGFDDADKEANIDNIVNQLKRLAADRPDNDVKYNEILKQEITQMIKDLPLKIQDNRDATINNWASRLATNIVSIPKNIDLSEDRTDFTFELEDGLEGLLKELGIIREALQQLKDNPNALQILAKRLNKLQAQGIDDDTIREKMQNEIRKFIDDLGIAQEMIDELVDELMNQVDDTVETSKLEIQNVDELLEIVVDWLNSIPGIDKINPRKLDKISRELVNAIKEAKEEGNDDIESEIFGRLEEADLPIDAEAIRKHIPDLLNKLDLWPSNKLYNVQAKQILLDDIYHIIDASKVPEERKQVIKGKVKNILDSHIMNASALDARQVQDYLKDALVDDVGKVITEEGITDESHPELLDKLSSAVSKNYFKSVIGLSRYPSDLKLTATKFIRDALDDIPMNGSKKKELIDELKNTLDKNINKDLPDDIEDTIAEEICGIVEESPVCEDDNIAKYLKCLLSSISTKIFDMFACKNNCVCHIQNRVENDVCDVIDRCPIDCNKKRDLKRNVQDILSDNENRELSEDAKQAVTGDIISVVSDLSIPEDKKDNLKRSVSETISQDFGDAIFGLKHDIGKVKRKLFDRLNNAIEKSPVSLDTKEYLYSKLKRMLNEKLDSTFTNEEKNMILDDVSDIVQDVMPEDKRTKLRNKLANKLDSQDNENVFTDEIKMSLIQNIRDIIENASIPKDDKNELTRQLTASLDNHEGESIPEVRAEIKGKIFDIINESPVVEEKQRTLKKELSNLLTNKMGGTSIDHIGMDDYKKKITNDITELFAKLPISEVEKSDIKYQIAKKVSDSIYRPITDDVKTKIKKDISNVVKESDIPDNVLPNFKSKLEVVLNRHLNVTSDEDKDIDVIKEDLKQNFSQAVEELPITNDKKRILKIKLKDSLVNNIDRKLTNQIQEDINKEIETIIDDSTVPDKVSESKVLDIKDEVADIVAGLHLDEYMREYVVNDWIKEMLTKNLEEVIESFPTDSKNKAKVKKDIEKMLVNNLYIPMTDTIKVGIRRDIINVVDKMGIDDEENGDVKRRLSSALAKGMDKKMSVGKGQDQIKSALQQIIQEGIENAPIPEYTQDLLGQETEYILNENLIQLITDEMKNDIDEQIDIILKDVSDQNGKYKKKIIDTIDKNLREIKSRLKADLEAKQAKETMLEKARNMIDGASVDKQKKLELKSNLDKTTADYLSMPFVGKVREDFQDDIEQIIKELSAAGYGEKRHRKISISVDESAEGEIQDQELTRYIDKLENETQISILSKLKKAIDAAPIYANKKTETKKNLLNIGKEYFDNTLTDDSLNDLKDDLFDMVDELQLPKETRSKMLQQLSNMIEDLMKSMKRKSLVDPHENLKVNVLHAIKNTVNYATIPKDKKLELKNQLTEMAVRVFNVTPLEKIQDALQDGASDILDDYPLIKDKKIKLRRDLEDSIEENVSSSENYYPKSQIKPHFGQVIPDFRVQKEEKTSRLIEEINRNKARKSILQGVEEIIDKSHLPIKKKGNLKEKLTKTIDKTFRLSVSKDLGEDLKDGIHDVLDETSMFDSDKYQLKDDLTNMVDKRMDIRRFMADENDIEGERLQNFFHNLEKSLVNGLIPTSKKNTLKNKLKILTDTGFKPPFSKGAQSIIREGVDEILEEMLLKDERNKYRKELRDIIGTRKNIEKVHREIKPTQTKILSTNNYGVTQPDENMKENEPNTIYDFFKVMENEINESHIFRRKKVELQINLQKVANDFLDKSWSENFKEDLKRGISNILDDLYLSRAKKHRLKSIFETLIDEPSEISSSLEPWKEGKDLQKYQLEIFFHKLEEMIDDNPVPIGQNKILKKKLKDLSSPGFKQPFTRKQRKAVYEILDALPLSQQEKSRFLKELANIFGDVRVKEKESQRSKPSSTYAEERFENMDKKKFEDFFHKFEEVIDQNPLPEYKKKVLKRKLKDLYLSGLRKSFTRQWRNGMYNIVDTLMLSEEEKNGFLNELGDIIGVDLYTEDESESTKSFATSVVKPDLKYSSKLFFFDERVITKARESIVKEIERKIKEAFIPGSKKAILISRLEKLASNELQKPLTEDGQEYVRGNLGNIINELPINKAEKDELTQMVEENIEILKDLNRYEGNSSKQIQENISSALNNIVNETLIVEEKKKILKKKLKTLVENTFEKVLPEIVHGALIDGVNDIINEAGLAKAKRDKLKVILMEAIDYNIGDLRDDEIDTTEDSREGNIYSASLRRVNGIKTRSIEISTDLAPFYQIDNFETKTRKEKRYTISQQGELHQSEKRVENRSKDSMPLKMKPLGAVDDPIADLRGETIGMDNKPIFKRKSIVEKYARPTEEAQTYKKRGSVLKVCEDKIEKFPVMHMELDAETLDEVTTDNLLTFAEDTKDDDTAELIEDIPVDQPKNHESPGVGIDSLLKLHGKRSSREQRQIQNILNALETPIDKSQLTTRQKNNLKEKLKIMFSKNYRIPLTDDLRDALKAEINVALNEMPLTNYRKNKLEYGLFASLDSHLNSQKDMSPQREGEESKLINTDDKPKTIQDFFKIIENHINESLILRRKKTELKNDLQKITEGFLKNTSSEHAKDVLRSGISNILNNLPISEAVKNILEGYMNKALDNNSVTFSSQGQWMEEKKLEKHPLELYFHNLTQIIDEKLVPTEKNKVLKKKLKDLSSLSFEKPLTRQQRNIVYDIIDVLPILEEEKNRYLKEFADILNVDQNMGTQGLRESKIPWLLNKDVIIRIKNIVAEIERKIEKAPMSISKKIKLLERLERMTSHNLQGPLSEGMRDYLIRNIEDVIEKLPIDESEKYELTQKVDVSIKLICDKRLEKEMQGKSITNQNSLPSKRIDENKPQYKKYDAESITINEIEGFNARFKKHSRDSTPVDKENTNKRDTRSSEKYNNYKTNTKPSTSSKAIDIFKPRESIVQIIEHKRSRGKRSRDEIEDSDDDYQAKDRRFSTHSSHTDEPDKSGTTHRSSTKDPDARKHARENILNELEDKIKEASISRRKRTELLEKLEKVSHSIKTHLSESQKNHIMNDLNDILEQLPIQEPDRNELTHTINENMERLIDNSLRKKELKLLEKTIEDNIHGFDEVTDKALISSKIKNELKKHLKELVNTSFHKPLDSSTLEELNNAILEVLNTLITSKNKKNILKEELFKVVEENLEKYENELKELLDHNGRRKSAGEIKDSIIKSVEHSAIGDDVKRKIQKEISEMLNSELLNQEYSDDDEEDDKSFSSLIVRCNLDPEYETELKDAEDELAKVILAGGDVDAAKEGLIKKIMNDTGLSREQAAELVDKLHKKANKGHKENFKTIIETFNLDPKYEKELKDVEDELTKVLLEGGDVDAVKEKLIKKIMDDTGLSREQATELLDGLHEKANKDNKGFNTLADTYNLDPEYTTKLKEAEDELTKVILEGGDIEAAKERLIKKIMDETGLPREQASELVNKLHANTNKDNKGKFETLTKTCNLDPNNEEHLKSAEDELKKVILEGGDVDAAKEMLITKIMNETGLPREKAAELVNKLHAKANEDNKDNFEALTKTYNLDTKYEEQLKGVEDELTKVILEGGDVEAAKERLIKKIMDETGLPREQATELVNKLHDKTNKDNKGKFETLTKTFNLDPKYEEELKGVEEELTKVILEGGDVEAAKENLIKKVMEETGLSREQAAELVNKLHAKTNEDNKERLNDLVQAFDLDPKYKRELKEVEDELTKVILEGGDVEAAKEKLIKKVMDETGLSREQAAELLNRLHAKANEDNKDNNLKAETKNVNVDPHYEKELKGVEDELTKVILEGGDVNAAKERLIKKIMDETGLPREQAAELVNRLHAKVNIDNKGRIKEVEDELTKAILEGGDVETAKEKLINKIRDETGLPSEQAAELVNRLHAKANTDNKYNFRALSKTYNLDPGYEKELKGAEDELTRVILQGGDVDAAKERLIKQIMNETGVLRDQAAEQVNRLHVNANKDVKDIERQTKTFDLDPKHLKDLKEEEEDLTRVILEGGDIEAAKEKLINKIIDETGLPREQAAELVNKLHAKANEDSKEKLNDLVQAFNLNPRYKKELKEVEDELTKVIFEGGDVEAAKKRLSIKIMDETGLPRDQAAELVNSLHVRGREIFKKQSLASISKYINDAIEKSLVSQSHKDMLEPKLIKKMEENFESSPLNNSDEIEVLRQNMISDSKQIIDESSIPNHEKPKTKSLIEDALADGFDNLFKSNESETSIGVQKDTESIGQSEEEIEQTHVTLYGNTQELRANLRNRLKNATIVWMQRMNLNLNPEVKTEVIENLTNDIMDRMKYLVVHPEVSVSDMDELENLRYQVFKRLSKLVPPEDMPTIIVETEELYIMIREIKNTTDLAKLGWPNLKG